MSPVLGQVLIWAALMATWVLLQSRFFLQLSKWISVLVYGVGSVVALWFMLKSIDFTQPVLLSVRWSTLGYLLLAVVLFAMAFATWRREVAYDDSTEFE